jgi:hypothetical protein
VERFHRRLKDALKACCAMDSWTDHLLWILLGLRSAAREYDKITPCQAVFSLPLILPGKFLDSCSYLDLLVVILVQIFKFYLVTKSL